MATNNDEEQTTQSIPLLDCYDEARVVTPPMTPQPTARGSVILPQTSREAIGSVKLPPFWTSSPNTWFIQAEAQFENAGTKLDRTKYAHLLTAMSPEIIEKVIDIVQNPPAQNRYTFLKDALLQRLSISEEQRISKLLYNAEMGDSSPSDFHRRLMQLAGSTEFSDKLIFRLWLGRLPKAIEIAIISMVISVNPRGNRINKIITITISLQSELIHKYGYPTERHEVITDDGYVLALTRIPPQDKPSNLSLPKLLVHGLFASSADFLIIGPNNSLAYLLADQGHDVWMADLRGNRYSRRHTTLSPDSRAYWDYTWHEMGCYDLPAMIDHILHVTDTRRLHYIGYSQGTTVFFVMASSRPEYNEKISRMYALSAAVYVEHIRSPIFRWIAENINAIKCFLDTMGLWQVLPHNKAQYALQRTFCPASKAQNICVQLIELLFGANPNVTDPLAQHVIAGHDPSGISSKQLQHFAQLNRSGRFQQFDYGRKELNLAAYGSEHPPKYNLSAVTTPVVIFYSLNDWMVDPANIVRLASELPNLVSKTVVEDRNFNHFDFMIAKRVRELVYDKILLDLNLEA
ncbi:lipase 1-like [Anopheles funestus]|uniref:lipase 1-like n=1 Tax=Anopheles funestus TaxID=62324 RepID=UPI0020C73E25|nr:lipase 1-like [Anopheles funestus]